MEVQIKECMQALRELWSIKAGLYREMILQVRERPLKKRYGIKIFQEATERLKKQGVKR